MKYIYLIILTLIHSIAISEIKIEYDILSKINRTKKFFNKQQEESYTILVYMAADNDLFPFAGRNIKQMQQVGSNDRIKIVVHFDMHRPGHKKLSKRFFIEKNKLTQIGPDLSMDSGDSNTLIDFCKVAIKNFPSDHYALVLWNHGTGILEPKIKRSLNPSELFTFNPVTKIIELNREIGFLDYINHEKNIIKESKGICFDDTTSNYLTNKKLKQALETICKESLNGKKLSILACDACLMSMIEVVTPLSNCVDYFVGSQEVELGTGYNYTTVLFPFLSTHLDPVEFSKHIVNAYSQTYGKITHDYTQSAFDLSKTAPLENNISELATLLIDGLKKQKNKSVKETLKQCVNKSFCTSFDEPSYKDLGHFYANLKANINKFVLDSQESTVSFKNSLEKILINGGVAINNLIIANTSGKNLQHARGVSIYFPENRIHSSYFESVFATQTRWLEFLVDYLKN